jgi:hypothetical protein
MRFRSLLPFLLVVAAVACVAPMAVQAQYRASIQGVVSDPSGAAIPGATLSLTDLSTNLTVTATSNGHGNYTFNALPADKFNLTVSAAGFSGKTLSGVTLIPEQANTINVKLTVGSLSESVNVDAGEVPALDTTTASISGTVTSNQIQHMPSFDRDVFRLVALAPGTFGDEAQSNGGNSKNMPGEDHGGPAATDGGIFETENNPQVIGNGSQVSANNILIDGISTSSANWGGASVITPSEESVEYLKVTSNAYDAEFGRFSGNAVQITSKSGTNTFHGSAFFKADRPGLNAYQRWNGQNSNDPLNAGKSTIIRNLLRNSTRFNQFGGSLGGPFWRDRFFGFFAYEGFRNGSNPPGQALYETASFLAAAPAGSIASKYATYPGEAALSTVQVPATCAVNYGIPDGPYCKTINGQLDIGSPLKTALGNYDPTWSSKTKPGIGSGLDGIPDLQLLATVNPTSNVGDQYNGRLDADVTHKDRLSFIIYWVPSSTNSINGASRAANQWNHQQINNAFTALHNHTFSPSLLNEARASASGWRWNEVDSNPLVPFGLPIDSFSNVGNGTQPQNFGPPNPSIFNQWTYAYQDILTKVAGRHDIKAGATFTNIQFLQEVIGNARPSFTFTSLWDFLNDAPLSENANFNPVTGVPGLNRQDERMNIFGTFVQDNFKITPTLTMNLGLRWNYFGPFHNKQNNLSIVTPGAGAALISGLTMTQGGNLYGVQKGNFGPQLGLAWNPDYFQRKVVIRGGFGVNYNEDEFAITVQGNANSPTLLNFSPTGYSSKNSSIQYNVAGDIHTPLAYPSNPHAITTFGPNGLPTATGLSVQVTGFDQNVKTITVYHYSLDTEMALSHNFVATLGYQGSSGHHLLYQEDLNAVAVIHGYALNPALSRVMMNINGANSNYNALLATMKHNFAHGFQIEGQYTWSKSMDEGSSPYTLDPYAPISIHSVYGRSDYNVQNAFRTFCLYQPSFFHEKWLHRIADGWSLGGIYNWHTGFPWTPVYSVTTNAVPTGSSGNLYYAGSPYTSIRPAAYTGTGLADTSTAGFETGPSLSNPGATNVNFPNKGPAYFTEPTYTAALRSAAYSPTLTYGAPTPAMARNSFNGSMYQDLDASLAKAFKFPETRVIGDKGALEMRVDAYNVFNLTNLTPTPSTNITSTTFGAATSALGSRSVQIQARFSF